ncbi:MAG: hypothetical protein JXX14_10970 [Deltaproteobacteria bacterium]|nr:hypothetical protein [Deltaproteobacteria bacterium]
MRTATLLILIITLFYAGCGPYEGPVLNSSDPKRLVPCQKPAGDDRGMISYLALNAVLAQNGWFVVAQSPDSKLIDARKCKNRRFGSSNSKHPMQRDKDECLDIRFTISSSGAVTLVNPPERRFYWKIEPSVNDWLEQLEMDYNQVRCYNSQDLAYWQQTQK